MNRPPSRERPVYTLRLAAGERLLLETAAERHSEYLAESQALNGFRRHEKVRTALAAHLRVSREDIDTLLDRVLAAQGQAHAGE